MMQIILLQNQPYPLQQNAYVAYRAQNQLYPGYATPPGPPLNLQVYPPLIIQAAPQPHGVTGNANKAGYLLQE